MDTNDKRIHKNDCELCSLRFRVQYLESNLPGPRLLKGAGMQGGEDDPPGGVHTSTSRTGSASPTKEADAFHRPSRLVLHKQLPLLMKNRNLTIRELSPLSGIPAKTLYHWRAGQRPVADERLFKVAEILGVGIVELLFGN